MLAGVLAVTHWPAQASHAKAAQQSGLAARQVAIDVSHPSAAPARGARANSRRHRRVVRHDSDRPDLTVNPPLTVPYKPPVVLPFKPPVARRHKASGSAATMAYRNPVRSIKDLIAERIDMGVDFGGTGPIYALGDAVVTNATAVNPGWPGGGWITYQLTSGPAAGLMVYVAEDVRPTVAVGQKVTASTVIAAMFNGGSGIETGWAMPDGASAESQLPVAGAIGGAGPFPTRVGVNFDELLVALGVPAGSNAGQSPFGLLPPSYPAAWAGLASKL